MAEQTTMIRPHLTKKRIRAIIAALRSTLAGEMASCELPPQDYAAALEWAENKLASKQRDGDK